MMKSCCKPALRHPLPAIRTGSGHTCGGDQHRLSLPHLRQSGCGLVACTDLLLYLHWHHPGCRCSCFSTLPPLWEPVEQERYDRCCRSLSGYFPITPKLGTNGWMLAAGLNGFFRRHGLPFHAAWGAPVERQWEVIAGMLAKDLPVVLSVGPNFPLAWQRHPLPFYQKDGDRYTRAGTMLAHYVTVTAMDDSWLRICSWGREYYLSRAELAAYQREHSCWPITSILRLEPRKI